MHNFADFDRLLKDRAHLDRTKAVHERLQARMDECPGVSDLTKALQTMHDKELVFGAIRDFYSLEKIHEILALEQEAFVGTPTYSATLQGNAETAQAFFLLARSHHMLSLLTAVDPHMLAVAKVQHPDQGKQVAFPSGNAEMVMLKGEMRCRLWTAASLDDATDLTEYRAGATPSEPFVLKAGDVLRQADFTSIEYLAHDKGGLFIHTQMMCGDAPLDIYCDYCTGELARTSAPEGKFSRYQMIATLMRILDRQDAFEHVASLLSEPFHFVRWHAMRELIGLDAERALPHLVALAETDPQPSVRRAARQTLAMVYGPGSEQAA